MGGLAGVGTLFPAVGSVAVVLFSAVGSLVGGLSFAEVLFVVDALFPISTPFVVLLYRICLSSANLLRGVIIFRYD